MKIRLYSILTLAALCCWPTISAAGPESGAASAAKKGTQQDSVVYLPLNRVAALSERTGSTVSVGREQLGKYPSVDLRNQLTGLIPGLEVVEKSGATGIAAGTDNGSVSLLSRGNNIRYIVDDMPVYISQLQLDPEQIESVTLLTDIADKAQFGPVAADGVLYIRTRRGGRGPLSVNLSFERGVSVVDRFPEWVNGVDYAKMNNYARYNDGMTPLYDGMAIAGFRKADPDHTEYPNADFRSMMLKDTKPYTRAGLGLSGGGNAVRYNAHFGYAGEGDIYKLGATSDYNRLNVHTNIEATITPRLKARVSFFGGMTFRRSPKYGYGTSNDDEMTAVLSDLSTIPAIAFPIHVTPAVLDETVEMEKNRTIYGV
ncbi:MAG: Plug domain-containing protein, partial [Alistipes sp.]|nr:Plug domain-containing protein [Alistipes sp.]